MGLNVQKTEKERRRKKNQFDSIRHNHDYSHIL